MNSNPVHGEVYNNNNNNIIYNNKVLFRVDTYHNIHKTQALQSFSNRLYI